MKTLSKSRLSVLLLLGTTSTLSYGYNWNGTYFGINTGYNSGSFTPSNLGYYEEGITRDLVMEIEVTDKEFPITTNKDFEVGKASFGLQLGRFYQSDNSPWVSGWEIDLQGFQKKNKNSPIIYDGVNDDNARYPTSNFILDKGQSQIRFNAKTKFLLGYEVNDRWLPYATVGVSFAKVNLTLSQASQACRRPKVPNSSGWSCEDLNNYQFARQNFAKSHSYTQYGIHYGVGVFYAFNEHWLINAEVSNTLLRPLSGYKDTKLSGSFHSFNLGLSYKF